MPISCRTTDEVDAEKIEDGKPATIILNDLSFFASGAFSNVYRGRATLKDDVKSMDVVIKKTWPSHKSNLTEIKILGILDKVKHKNVVRLLYTYQRKHEDRMCLWLIFERVADSLHQFVRSQDRKIDIIEVKLITWQMFRGQAHLHNNNVTHRDIKPQNLLYDPNTGLLKIADFGSSTNRPAKESQTSYHVTRYYRPPELIFGSKHYGPQIDIWSCGCVLGELLKGHVLLAGTTSSNQGEVIFDMLGMPSKEDVKSMSVDEEIYKKSIGKYKPDGTKSTANMKFLYDRKPDFMMDRKTKILNDKISLPDMKTAVKLLRKILVYNPSKRYAGAELLQNDYFAELFHEGTVRFNKKKIGCLTTTDLFKVQTGDKTTTFSSTGEEAAH